MIKEAISKAMNKENLTREEALQVMKEIMSGEAEQSQVAAFLVALHMKGGDSRGDFCLCRRYAKLRNEARPWRYGCD